MHKKYYKPNISEITVKLEPKSENQFDYIRAIAENKIIFCTGPAGTGKTCIALTMALQKLVAGEITRIIVSRPLVQTGQRGLGYLPGSLEEKIEPFMQPALDEFHKYIDPFTLEDLLRNKVIEFAPLEMMRGRNFHQAYCIVDEAQNADADQIEMFLTRIGSTSKAMVVGDVSQSDLYDSGLQFGMDACKSIEGIAVVKLTTEDIVRDDIVGKVIRAFDEHRRQRKAGL